MVAGNAVVEAVWERYPLIASNSYARRWIQSCVMLGLARNTIAPYMYAAKGFLRFAQGYSVDLRSISRETIAQYVGELRSQPRRANVNVVGIDSGGFLSNATLQQRLIAVRLLLEFLVDEGLIRTNPVSRGRYTASSHFGARGKRGKRKPHSRSFTICHGFQRRRSGRPCWPWSATSRSATDA
ncbi:putative integrase [Candidatus Burkholderia brachyanthoides]|nr:putative integrase [Candidatus Burkholderia brachyanthoides]